jgi:hypothetical protein
MRSPYVACIMFARKFESLVFRLNDHTACEDQSMETWKGKGGVQMRKGVKADSNGFSPISISFFSISPECFFRAVEMLDKLPSGLKAGLPR